MKLYIYDPQKGTISLTATKQITNENWPTSFDDFYKEVIKIISREYQIPVELLCKEIPS